MNLNRFNRVIALGRRSTRAYLRFYPNPGFMLPWFGGRQLLWSRSDGWYTRSRNQQNRPKFNAARAHRDEQYAQLIRGQGVR